MLITFIYRITRKLLSTLATVTRRDVSKNAELLVLRHENAVLRRQITKVRYGPADRFWFAASDPTTARALQFTLGIYQNMRRRLDDELGILPGRELAEAHLLSLSFQLLPSVERGGIIPSYGRLDRVAHL